MSACMTALYRNMYENLYSFCGVFIPFLMKIITHSSHSSQLYTQLHLAGDKGSGACWYCTIAHFPGQPCLA